MKTLAPLLAIAAVLGAAPHARAAACPTAVTSVALAAHPGATVASCKEQHEDGRDQFEVKLEVKGGGRMELDVSPEGTILLTEERVAVGEVPQAVTRALATKYPAAKPTRAEKQTAADGSVTYELAFASGGKTKEATFKADGSFVEEE